MMFTMEHFCVFLGGEKGAGEGKEHLLHLRRVWWTGEVVYLL